MYFVYVLRSLKDNKLYTGFTDNLKRRFEKHLSGKVTSTKHRRNLEIVYVESCLNKIDAVRREKYLKSGVGKKFLRSRLKFWYKELDGRGPKKVSG